MRGTTSERGYDYEWQQLRLQYQKENPFCEECKRRGRLEFMAVVDHIIPVADRPDLRLDWDNLQSLCHHCHNVWKRRIEAYARAAHKIDDLQEWCRHPEKRPKALRIG